MKPFLKWVGGKTQLLPELLKHVPPTFGTYYEPFLGGGALFFELSRLGLLKHGAVLSDVNEELINCYRQVRDHVGDVLLELSLHRDEHSEQHYYAVRAGGWSEGDPATALIERAARFIYINKAGFNGLWRVNKQGKCNVPWGKHKTYEPDEENLSACANALRGVELVCCDVLALALRTNRGDLVYADPPYFPVSKTADFTGYTKGGFGPDAQGALAHLLGLWKERGVRIIASNADVPECRKIYGFFAIHEVQARRSVNCKGGKRGPVGELIITGEKS